MYLALVLVGCARAALGVIVDGVCDPNVKPAANIEDAKVPGLWHGYESYGDDSSSCATAVRIQIDGNKYVFDSIFIEDGQPHKLRGSGHYENGISFHKQRVFSTKGADLEKFMIVDVDENASALMYHCKQVTPTTKNIVVWKFRKDPVELERARARNDAAAQRYPELAKVTWRNRADCPTAK